MFQRVMSEGWRGSEKTESSLLALVDTIKVDSKQIGMLSVSWIENLWKQMWSKYIKF